MPNTDQGSPIETAVNRPDIKSFRCVRCGTEFHCGMNGADRPCWCADYPHLMPVPQKDAGCYCPACLDELTAGNVSGAASS
jgi:hypothetical protein